MKTKKKLVKSRPSKISVKRKKSRSSSKTIVSVIFLLLTLFSTVVLVQSQQSIRQFAQIKSKISPTFSCIGLGACDGSPTLQPSTIGQLCQDKGDCTLGLVCNENTCVQPTTSPSVPCPSDTVTPDPSESGTPDPSESDTQDRSESDTPDPSESVTPNPSDTESPSATIPPCIASGTPSASESATESATEGNTNTCKNKYDLNANPDKKNFGDPKCDFDKNKLYAQLKKEDPQNADKFFNIIVPCQSGFEPNKYHKCKEGSKSGCEAYDPVGMWGLFSMGKGRNGTFDRGNVEWQKQISNAIGYNNILAKDKKDFRYWGLCAKTIWGSNAGNSTASPSGELSRSPSEKPTK